ncbi:hypothetical protein JCM5296_004166 [Sporobolomyces johnsonii]
MTAPAPPSSHDLAIAVFCGASPGNDPVYIQAAESVARAIAQAGKTLVYGGGTKGLMGKVASSALEHGGRVHGVIPSAFLSAEAPDRGNAVKPNEIETVVKTMHERKKLMSDLSGAFIGLPGGYGTLEEVAEMTTWSQLAIISKPVVLLNINGFYTPLRNFIEGAISAGFIPPKNRNFLVFLDPSPSPEFDWGRAALDKIREWKAMGSGGAEPFSFEWEEGRPREEVL